VVALGGDSGEKQISASSGFVSPAIWYPVARKRHQFVADRRWHSGVFGNPIVLDLGASIARSAFSPSLLHQGSRRKVARFAKTMKSPWCEKIDSNDCGQLQSLNLQPKTREERAFHHVERVRRTVLAGALTLRKQMLWEGERPRDPLWMSGLPAAGSRGRSPSLFSHGFRADFRAS